MENANTVRRQISNHVNGIERALKKARNAKNGQSQNVQTAINTNHVQKIANLKSRANKLKAKAAGNFGISALVQFGAVWRHSGQTLINTPTAPIPNATTLVVLCVRLLQVLDGGVEPQLLENHRTLETTGVKTRVIAAVI